MTAGTALLFATLIACAAPATAAAAASLGPVGGVGDVLGAGINAITGGLGGAAVDGFGAILKALFVFPERMINRHLLAWLLAVPDYAIAPRTGGGARAPAPLAGARGFRHTGDRP